MDQQRSDENAQSEEVVLPEGLDERSPEKVEESGPGESIPEEESRGGALESKEEDKEIEGEHKITNLSSFLRRLKTRNKEYVVAHEHPLYRRSGNGKRNTRKVNGDHREEGQGFPADEAREGGN